MLRDALSQTRAEAERANAPLSRALEISTRVELRLPTDAFAITSLKDEVGRRVSALQQRVAALVQELEAARRERDSMAARLRATQTRLQRIKDAVGPAVDHIDVPLAAADLASGGDKGALRKVKHESLNHLHRADVLFCMQLLESEAEAMVSSAAGRIQALTDKALADAEARWAATRDPRVEAKLRDEVHLLTQQLSALELQLHQARDSNRLLAAAKDDALREHEKVSGICARLHQLHDSTTALLKNSKKQFEGTCSQAHTRAHAHTHSHTVLSFVVAWSHSLSRSLARKLA